MAKVLNITEAVTIALHSMIIIANRPEKQVNVNVISNAINSSKFHVAKIMQKLVKEGFLGSHRGPSGGFYLRVKPDKLTLLQIYETIEGKIATTRCPIDHDTCPFSECVFEDLTVKMTNDFISFLESRTLADYQK
jgi:Rrf2 family protein